MTAREIADKLSRVRTQREAFLTACTGSLRTARVLVGLDLFRTYARDAISKLVQLREETPLGIEVRAILEEQSK